MNFFAVVTIVSLISFATALPNPNPSVCPGAWLYFCNSWLRLLRTRQWTLSLGRPSTIYFIKQSHVSGPKCWLSFMLLKIHSYLQNVRAFSFHIILLLKVLNYHYWKPEPVIGRINVRAMRTESAVRRISEYPTDFPIVLRQRYQYQNFSRPTAQTVCTFMLLLLRPVWGNRVGTLNLAPYKVR